MYLEPMASHDFQSSLFNQFCGCLPPLESQIFPGLAAVPWLPPHRRPAEEAGMCVKEEMEALPGFYQITPSFLPLVCRIPLSANLGSSIKRRRHFKYPKFCLEIKFQSFDCIWSVCLKNEYHSKGQTTAIGSEISRKQWMMAW